MLAACGDDSRPSRDTGVADTNTGDQNTGDMMSVDTTVSDTPLPDSGPPPDPFDPASGCGAAAVETMQVPGSVLLAFDQSGSMAADVNGERPPIGDSKWTLATNAINRVLTSMPDDLNVGLMLFPSPGSGDCNVDPAPQVPIGPLSTTRTSIMSQLSGSPDGGGTPAIAAVEAAYRYIQPLPLPGQRGVILVTDGGESCQTEETDRNNAHNNARTNNLAYNI